MPLGELTDKIGSGATPRGGQSAYKETGVSLIRSLNVHDLEFRYKDLARIDNEEATALSNVEVEARDVLLNITGASIARCAQVPLDVLPARVNQHVSILRPKKGLLDSRFLSYLLVSDGTKNQLLNIGDKAGATRQALTKAQLQAFAIPVPPLDEQKRIVAVLDQAFAALDRARAHAEANLADCMELFDRYLSHEMSGIGNASGIPSSADANTKLMKDIVTFHNGDRGKNYPNKNEYVVDGIPWINTGHIMKDGSLSEEKMNFISEAKFKQLGGGKTKAGDLVFCLRGATIGKTAFVGPYSPGAVASSLMIIRPGKEILDKYAYYFLTSELGKSEISRFIGGAAQPNLAGKSVGEFNVPLPSIEQQKRIVERIGAVKRNVEKSKRRYLQKLTDLANLRQSLLQQAFSGELT